MGAWFAWENVGGRNSRAVGSDNSIAISLALSGPHFRCCREPPSIRARAEQGRGLCRDCACTKGWRPRYPYYSRKVDGYRRAYLCATRILDVAECPGLVAFHLCVAWRAQRVSERYALA